MQEKQPITISYWGENLEAIKIEAAAASKISHHCGWLISSASGLLCATKLTAYDARICKNGFVKFWRRLRSPVLSPLCRSGSAPLLVTMQKRKVNLRRRNMPI